MWNFLLLIVRPVGLPKPGYFWVHYVRLWFFTLVLGVGRLWQPRFTTAFSIHGSLLRFEPRSGLMLVLVRFRVLPILLNSVLDL